MDLETLKEALGEETHAALTQYITELTGQRDAARQESIKHRTGLKAKVTELEKVNADLARTQEEMLERLGVESIEALTTLDPKGQAEAAKQYEAKLKLSEKKITEHQAAYDQLFNRYRGSLQDAAIHKALTAHEWSVGSQKLAVDHLARRIAWDDDQIMYKTDDGALIPLEEGINVLVKETPQLLKGAGTGGSGYRGKPVNGDAKPSLTRAQFEALPPADRASFFRTGGQLSE